MILHTERGNLRCSILQGIVVQVEMGRAAAYLWIPGRGSGDFHLSCGKVLDRLVDAAVPELGERSAAQSQPHDLVAEADTEHGALAGNFAPCQSRVHGGVPGKKIPSDRRP